MTQNQNSIAPLNLYQRMLLVSTEVMNVEKNTTVAQGKANSYKAVADYDVVVAVKRAEEKFGIISVPINQELVDTQILTSTDSYGNQKTQFVDIVKVTMEIYNVDNPEDSITIGAFGRGIDPSDKGFGKASTYARKYCLLNAYKIATGEDPDKDASEDAAYIKKAPQAAPVQASAQAPKVEQPVIVQGSLEDAINQASRAKSADELYQIFNQFKAQYGKNVMFVQAIANNPVNPKRRK